MRSARTLTGLFLAAAVLFGSKAPASERSPVGVWDITVFFTRPEGLPVVKALYTFTPGGGFVMTAQNDRRTIGPGHGIWTRTGRLSQAASRVGESK